MDVSKDASCITDLPFQVIIPQPELLSGLNVMLCVYSL